MNPYYSDDKVTLYHGDCREILPSLGWEGHVVTDPPYGTGYYAHDTDAMSGSLLNDFCGYGGTVALFGWPERLVRLCMVAGRVPDAWVTWWPTNGAAKAPRTSTILRESEHVAVFGERHEVRQDRSAKSRGILAKPYGDSRCDPSQYDNDTRRAGDVWTDPAPGIAFLSHLRQHPNEKPVSVMHRLLTLVGPGPVLDPFAGSGTTLRAATDDGRTSVGIEVDEAHCETTAKRLAQGALDFGVA